VEVLKDHKLIVLSIAITVVLMRALWEVQILIGHVVLKLWLVKHVEKVRQEISPQITGIKMPQKLLNQLRLTLVSKCFQEACMV
jgi:hypothetical protein